VTTNGEKLSSAYLGYHGMVSELYKELEIEDISDKTVSKKDRRSYFTLTQ